METFASLKIMNNQIHSFRSIAAAVALAGGAFLAQPVSAQKSPHRVSVNLSDPARPAFIKASMVNGGITVKAYDGKEVIVEARTRNEEREKPSSGPKRI